MDTGESGDFHTLDRYCGRNIEQQQEMRAMFVALYDHWA
jgi:hypothetical protein